jgi:DNA ligase-1
MPLIKPPSFDQLVKIYGSPKKAVLHLVDSGYSAEEISWKMDIPYHLVQLYMNRINHFKPILFLEITKLYERLAILRVKGKETELARFFKRENLDLETKARLALGKIVDTSLGIGGGIIERAMSTSTGSTDKTVKQMLTDYGEHGDVASLLIAEKHPSKKPKLLLEEVYESIKLLPKIGKVKERDHLIASLLEAATPQEAKYIVRLLLLDLKLGYKDKTVINAAARAYNLPPELIEKACAIIGLTEGILLAQEGEPVLSNVKLRPGQFFKPQLAQLYQPDKVVYPTLAEHKLDGSRLQIHKWGTQIWLYSRRGNEKSQTLPEIVELSKEFKAQSFIVDSELLAVDQDGLLLPFQILLRRTVPLKLSEEAISTRKEEVAVTIRAFDIIYLNGRELVDLPLFERRKFLIQVVPPKFLIKGKECRDEVELMNFFEETLQQRSEGIVVKNLNAPYEFGRRTINWLKLKPERDTIDCTLIKALYGKGKRAGLYTSFLMAIKSQSEKKLYTIGKVSNLPELTLRELKKVVESTQIGSDEDGVFIKPSIVVEVTFQEIQIADEYTSGYALRVPKVVRFRPDKNTEEIDVIERMQELYELQYGREISQTS